MHRRLLVGVLTLAAMAAAPAVASAESISGTVTQDGSGTPLQNVCVGVFNSFDSAFVGGGLTAANGTYTVTVTNGSYKVLFTTTPGGGCPGPQTTVAEYYQDKTDIATANVVTVGVGADVTGINGQVAPFVAPSTGSISGTISNVGAQGIQNVCVFALDDANQMTPPFGFAQTDANGNYAITGLAADGYKIGITTDPMFCTGVTTRIVDEYYQDTTVFADATVVVVTAGNATDVDATVATLATANDDAPTVNEDAGASSIAVLANDVNGDSTGANQITAVGDPPNGTAAIVDGAPDTINYTPDANFCGTDSFSYTITGGDTATVTVTVTCVNDPPAGTNGTVTTNEDTDHVFAAANFGFTDVDAGDSLSVVRVDSLPAQGTLRLDNGLVSPGQLISAAQLNAGQFTYSPPANQCGVPFTTFTFSVRDASSAYDPSPNTLTVNVACVNDAPAGTNGAVTTNEDTNRAFAAGDFGFSDVDQADALSAVRIDTLPGQGTLRLSGVAVTAGQVVGIPDLAAGNLTYAVPANVCGTPFTTFTFSVRDGSSAFDPSPNTLTVNVSCVDDPPTADGDGTTTVAEDSGATSIGVLANDDDIDGGPMEVDSVSDPANGSASVVQGSPDQVAYTPDPNYCGSDSFTYTLNGGSASIVNIAVTCADDAPTAVPDSPAVSEDSGASTLDVVGNDTDVDAGPKTVASKSDGNNGTVAITNSGANVSYTPNANYCGADSFTYTLNGGSSTTVSVAVACVDDSPTAANDSKTVTEDAPATPIDVLANDTDVDGGAKSVASTTDAPHGVVAITGGGTGVTYRPDPDYCGPDSFTYALNGGSSGTVALAVTCVADPVPDTTPPETTITKGPKKRLTITSARVRVKFAFASSEPGSTFQCKLDKGAFRACSSPKAYKVKPGRHTFRVRAIDAAGNVDETPAVRKVRVIRA
jgi:hypothetical protein